MPILLVQYRKSMSNQYHVDMPIGWFKCMSYVVYYKTLISQSNGLLINVDLCVCRTNLCTSPSMSSKERYVKTLSNVCMSYRETYREANNRAVLEMTGEGHT